MSAQNTPCDGRRCGAVAVVALCLALAAACTDKIPPVAPGDGVGSSTISDAAHSLGNADFFFLPPLVPDPSGHPAFDVDGFDPTRSPRVEICEVSGSDCSATPSADFPLVFTMTGGPGSETVRLNELEEHYIVNWHTRNWELDEATTYRIRVLTNGVELGYADVDIVSSGRELRDVNPDASVAVLNGRTLPIKFRIEVGAIVELIANGAGRHFGPLPTIIYALAENDAGVDIYPPGDEEQYRFGLFDTGSTKVAIFNELPYSFWTYPQEWDPNDGLTCVVPNRLTDANWWSSDAFRLGLTAPETVRLRLNGLNAIDPTSLGAPIGSVGTDAEPQVEFTGVQVEPEPTPESGYPLDVTLIGAPATLGTVALIDYTQKVRVEGYDFYPGLTDPANSQIPGFMMWDYVEGPDITFYTPGDPAIPTSEVELELTSYGTPAFRFLLTNVEFQLDGLTVSDQDPAADPIKFLFDTGTTPTIIGDRIAGLLGLTAGAGTFDCLSGTSNGYTLDAVVMTGTNGTYTVTDPSVCWSEAGLNSTTLSAVIGSNLFDQVPVVFDGPQYKLGIGAPTAMPIAWQSPPRNCAN